MLDLVNGCFELFGGFFILLSVLQLQREKRVAGVSWVHIGFFTCWGWWNLVYYSGLGQWLSWTGGLLLVTVNTLYLLQMLYYRRYPGGRHAYQQ